MATILNRYEGPPLNLPAVLAYINVLTRINGEAML